MIIDGKDIERYINSQAANTVKWAQKNLIDIFSDNWSYIIDANMRTVFTPETLEKMRPFVTKEFNIVKSVINKISMIYKNPAIRRAKIGENTYDEVYENVIAKARIDTRMKIVNRYTNLLNNVLVRPVMVDGELKYHVYTFDNCTTVQDEDNPARLIAVQYFVGLSLPDYDSIYRTNISTMDYYEEFKYESYKYRVLYTIEESQGGAPIVMYRKYRFADKSLFSGPREELIEEKPLPQYVDSKGRAALPFSLFTREESTDGQIHFTQGLDLVDGGIGIALMLVELFHLIKYQSFKQGYIVSSADQIPKAFFSDPGSWIHIPQDAQGKSGSAGVLDMQSDFIRLWEAIKQRVVMILAMYNINPNQFLQTATPASGFAIALENAGLIEDREDDIPRYEDFERDLYHKTVMVYNADRAPGMPEMARNAEFVIDFGKVNMPVNSTEQIAEELHAITNNIESVVDIIMRRNPSLSREEAEKRYADNIEMNKRGRAASSMIDSFRESGISNPDSGTEDDPEDEDEDDTEGEGEAENNGAE